MSVPRILARNTALSLFGRFAIIAVWFFLTPIILARLGREAFGFWSILMLLGGSFSFFDLGLTATTTRFVARLAAHGAWDATSATVRRAVLACIGFGALVAGAGVLTTPLALEAFHVPAAWRDQAALAYALSFVCFGIMALGGVLQGALNGLQRMDITSLVGPVLAPVVIFMILYALSFPRPLVAVMVAQVIQMALGVAVLSLALRQVIAHNRRIQAESGQAPPAPRLREMIRFGTQVQIGVMTAFLHTQVDKILLGTMVGLTWVAPFELGLRVANGVGSLPQIFLGALMPTLAHLDARDAQRGRGAVYLAVFEPFLLLVLPLCLAVALFADPLIQLWLGSPRPDVVFALRMLIASLGLTLLSGVAATTARAGGRPAFEAHFGLIALTLHVPLGLIALRMFGWKGTLVAGVFASVIASAWLLWTAERWLELKPFRALGEGLGYAGVPAAVATVAGGLVAQLWPPVTGRASALPVLGSAGLVFLATYVGVVRLAFPSRARRFVDRIRTALPARWSTAGETGVVP